MFRPLLLWECWFVITASSYSKLATVSSVHFLGLRLCLAALQALSQDRRPRVLLYLFALRRMAVMSLSLFFFLLAAVFLPGEYVDAAYGPVLRKDNCPNTPLVRNASDGLAGLEEAYVKERKLKADEALAAWLQRANPDFNTTILPTVALAHSGGGYRTMLTGAGIIKAFDSRDSNVSTSGLLQSMVSHLRGLLILLAMLIPRLVTDVPNRSFGRQLAALRPHWQRLPNYILHSLLPLARSSRRWPPRSWRSYQSLWSLRRYR